MSLQKPFHYVLPILVLTLVLFAFPALAGSRSGKTVKVTASPFYLSSGWVRVQGEFLASDQWAFGADIMSGSTSTTDDFNRTVDVTISWQWPYVRYYHELEDTFYAGAGLILGQATSTTTTDQYNLEFSGSAVEAGYSWLWETFTLDWGMAQVSLGELKDDEGNSVGLGSVMEMQLKLGVVF